MDLMNDWEIGGTQNPWVCPSDRHLQLRAQLKSGWSVRTASARSPTNSKQNIGGISDAEQEQIRKVLARAEAGKQSEQQRIGKMVDRLEKMRSRATGNGVTQCLLCSTDFGLLASKSYAAMCMDCRKYVCQKNCGVETYDQKRGEPIFLCKICSEYREVMWKKSGAWFYKEMPTYVKPPINGNTPGQTSQRSIFWQPENDIKTNLQQLNSPTNAISSLSLQENLVNQSTNSTNQPNSNFTNANSPSSPRVSRQLPIPPDQQQRLKTIPRPRITPSWVHEKVQSSMSLGSEEEESSSCSSIDRIDFKQANIASNTINTKRRHNFHRSKDLTNRHETPSSQTNNLQRFAIGNHVTDTDESENDESRRTTPSTSPRHSLATPSSYGGDDLSQNHVSLAANEASDAKSIDSVVQSDHSAQQAQLHQSSSNNLSLTPKGGTVSPPQSDVVAKRLTTTPVTQIITDVTSPPPPPLPPRAHTASPAHVVERSTSSASSSTASSSALFHHNVFPTLPHREAFISPSPYHPRFQQSRESLNSVPTKPSDQSRSGSVHSTEMSPLVSSTSNADNTLMPDRTDSAVKLEESTSPTFMSSPDDDTKSALEKLLKNSDFNQRSKSPFQNKNGSIFKKMPKTPKTILDSVEESESSNSSNKTPHEIGAVKNILNVVCKRDGDSDDYSVCEKNYQPKKVSFFTHCLPKTARQRFEAYQSTLGSIQFNLTYLHEDKQLIIHLIRAKNLKAMDKNGFSDPYVKFHIIPGNAKATKLTSKTIEKTLNPEWHEELIYYGITEEDRQRKTLRITVLDRDRIGSDFLGETRVALRKLPLGQMKKFNLYLEHAMPTPVEKTEDAERGKILLSICYNIQQGSLFVHIKRCAELLGMDSTGFSDPYCKVSLTPLSNKAHRQKTAIKKRTLNPEFNEVLQFIVPFKDLPKKTLEIGVYDHDVGKHDDYIGGIVLSTTAKAERGQQWTSCIENPGKTFEAWHKLDPNT
uniref:Rabphilin n=1 Tax=Panagrolaimus sp. JU765 TaxID=591449 RepID=A0AC34QU02_9BILA